VHERAPPPRRPWLVALSARGSEETSAAPALPSRLSRAPSSRSSHSSPLRPHGNPLIRPVILATREFCCRPRRGPAIGLRTCDSEIFGEPGVPVFHPVAGKVVESRAGSVSVVGCSFAATRAMGTDSDDGKDRCTCLHGSDRCGELASRRCPSCGRDLCSSCWSWHDSCESAREDEDGEQ
jgi:hypothetical protein